MAANRFVTQDELASVEAKLALAHFMKWNEAVYKRRI